jgi:hypothetical protein
LTILACFVSSFARYAIAVVAGIHVLFMLIFFRSVIEVVEILDIGLAGILLFVTCGVTLPMGLLLLTYGSIKPATDLNLPAGYGYSLTRRRELSTSHRLMMLGAFSIAAPFVFFGGPAGLLLVAVFVMPIVIGSYLVFHMVTSFRREAAPDVQRRIRITPRMRKPAQTRHHWTVNDSEYLDPDQYEQSPGRPRIGHTNNHEDSG